MQKEDEFIKRFNRIRASLLALAKKWCDNSQDAEDLVQDTAVRAYRKYAEHYRENNFPAWVKKIMRNIRLNQVQGKNRHFQYVDLLEVGRVDINSMADPASRIDDYIFEEMLNFVAEHLEGTNSNFYAVWDMAVLKDMTYAEIAETLDIPVGTVRSRLSRARRLVKGVVCDNYYLTSEMQLV